MASDPHLRSDVVALFDLAVRGHDPNRAVQRLQTAVEGHTDAYARSRAISRTKLATLLMITGDPREAVATGNAALDEVGKLHSQRATRDMADLHTSAARRATISEVEALRVRIADTVRA